MRTTDTSITELCLHHTPQTHESGMEFSQHLGPDGYFGGTLGSFLSHALIAPQSKHYWVCILLFVRINNSECLSSDSTKSSRFLQEHTSCHSFCTPWHRAPHSGQPHSCLWSPSCLYLSCQAPRETCPFSPMLLSYGSVKHTVNLILLMKYEVIFSNIITSTFFWFFKTGFLYGGLVALESIL